MPPPSTELGHSGPRRPAAIDDSPAQTRQEPREAMPEAKLTLNEHGLKPQGEGWYILNAKDAEWRESPHFGQFLNFEGDVRFPEVGINLHILQPGQPACKYHSERPQEAFLVLSGRCLLLVEGEERELNPWDFFHCASGVEHVFVGAGQGPCLILMVGNRVGDEDLNYPRNELAAKYGASVESSTPDPKVAYDGLREMRPIPSPLNDLPGGLLPGH